MGINDNSIRIHKMHYQRLTLAKVRAIMTKVFFIDRFLFHSRADCYRLTQNRDAYASRLDFIQK